MKHIVITKDKNEDIYKIMCLKIKRSTKLIISLISTLPAMYNAHTHRCKYRLTEMSVSHKQTKTQAKWKIPWYILTNHKNSYTFTSNTITTDFSI